MPFYVTIGGTMLKSFYFSKNKALTYCWQKEKIGMA